VVRRICVTLQKGTATVKTTILTALRAGAAPIALSLALASAPALAQDDQADAAAADDEGEAIYVTGSILSRTNTETVSPVTVLSTAQLEQRGVNTVAEGLQRLSANGSGAVSEGWNNGNNFAAGANAVSLRGLTVQKTLTVFDGMRMAPYPLADDGHRNFVDLNTIPDNIVERIEVLKDGASSTYGADAIAGVVNIITKKEIQGLHINGSAGISQEGDGAEQRLDVAYGIGDLESDGFNVYLAGTYRNNDVIWARNRDYPWNSGDLSGVCNDAGSCMSIPTRWYEFGLNANGTLGGSTLSSAPMVARGTETGARTSQYELLNDDCGAFGGEAQTLPDAARGFNPATGLYSWDTNVCQRDLKKAFATIRPETERYGFAARATAKVNDSIEAYFAGNYMSVYTYSQLAQRGYQDSTTAAGYTDPELGPVGVPGLTVNPIILPVYVCPEGVGGFTFTGATTAYNTSEGCTAANGVLNPNNPYAADGEVALVRGRWDRPFTVETQARSLRAAAGVEGTFGANDEWNFQVEATGSEVKLTRTTDGAPIPQRLADVIADGSWNFVSPWENSEELRQYVAPTSIKTSTSKLWQIQGTIGRELFELPGGPLQAAVGAAYRKESIDDQSANPANLQHPLERYYAINAVGAVGSRNVKSAFYEISAPIIDQLELNASGRYDDYSSGQSNFSPKFGAVVRPIDQIMLRGTWSKGFRIPSFNEAFGLPTTGFITLGVDCGTDAAPGTQADFCRAHSPDGTIENANAYATGQYQLGKTSFGNIALDPERSTSWTLGTVVEPMRNLSFTIDYFNIKVKDVIAGLSAADQDAALNAFIENGNATAVPGVTVIGAPADPQFPDAPVLPAFVQFQFQNADQEAVQGVDFGVDWNHNFGEVRFSTHAEASYLIKYQVTRQDGSVERYDGTLSPCDYTSCSGSPKWRATWSSTVGFGAVDVTPTVYYTGGYDLASIDYGGVKGDCEASVGASVVTYQDGTPVRCSIGAQWNVDLAVNYEINEHASIYLNVLNVLGIDPKFDPSAAYSIFQYNPTWGQPNMVGRYFRLGAKLDF
jgi:iron complex outermembrane receptor protein